MRPFTRVFALAPDCHTVGRYQRVWDRHFYKGLQGALRQVVLPVEVQFDWARPAADAPRGSCVEREETSERVWRQIQRAHGDGGLDAVISYCFSADLETALIERTIALGVPWINFFCDSTYAFDLVETLARRTSLNWFPENAAVARYQALGRPLLCRPYAVHPAALPEASCQNAEHVLGFIGAPTSNRILRLAGLWLHGCPVAVRGEGWQRVKARPRRPSTTQDRRTRGRLAERLMNRAVRPIIQIGARALNDEEMLVFLSRCRVVLGLNEGRDLQGVYTSYLKLRDVEFPGYGACYLTQHNADVADAFDVGREVLTFRHVKEAAALVRWAARHPAAARAIGHAGRRRVLGEHTWAARLSELSRAL
jgi:hypothetical protein